MLFTSAAFASGGSQITQGYGGPSTLRPGMIVALNSSNPNDVVMLSQQDVSKMLGVVISPTDAAITIGQTNQRQIYVTNYGTHEVLVSTQNGPINVGDYISISSLAGIGMKADPSESVVLGQAAAAYNGQTGTSVTLNTSSGKQTVELGEIPVNISVSNNPLAAGPRGLPTFLGKITKFATNKSVSAARVYLSMFIVVLGMVVTITIIYSGVRSGLISLGRNPLAKKVINGGIVKVVVVGTLIFAASLGAAYAVLL